MKHKPIPRRRRRAFTLLETIFGLAILVSILAALTALILIFARGSYKNVLLVDGTSETRKIQEHINYQLSAAIAQRNEANPAASIRPQFSDPSPTSPVRYGRITYRTAIGPYATTQGTTLSSASSITLDCPGDLRPQAGDWLVIESPDLGRGIQISSLSDSRTGGAAGTVTLNLASAISVANVPADSVAIIQRESAYETVAPAAGSNVTLLRWYPSTASSANVVLSTHVDAASRYLFAQIPEDASAEEVTVSWQFTYRADNTQRRDVPGNQNFLDRNFATGLIFPKSGNPMAMASISGISTSISTTSTSTTSTSTTSTSTTSTTTTKKTSTKTTSKSTTKKTSTKTTSKSTTSTKKTTSASTTKKSTTKSTSKSTTSTSTTKATTSTIPFDG